MVAQFALLLLILIHEFNFNLSHQEKCLLGMMTVEDCGCEMRYSDKDDSNENLKTEIFCTILDKKANISVDAKTLSINCSLTKKVDIHVELAKMVNLKKLAREVFFNRTNIKLNNCFVSLNTSVIPLLDHFYMKECKSFIYQANVGSSLKWKFFDGFINLERLILTDNNITLLETGVFQAVLSIKSLDISRNELINLPEYLFSDLKMKNAYHTVKECGVVELRLSYNKLTTVSRFMFTDMPNLMEIHLDHNHLKHINCHAFEATHQLQFVHLNNNQLSLSDCRSSIFVFLDELKFLNLSSNVVTSIQPDWMNIKTLSNLDLSFNQISSLTNEDLKFKSTYIQVNVTNNQIKHLNLTNNQANKSLVETLNSVKLLLNYNPSYNPLNCDCNLYNFSDYVFERNIIVVDYELICESPETMKRHQPLQINFKDLTCDVDDSNCPHKCKCKKKPHASSVVLNYSNSNSTVIPSINMLNSFFFETINKWGGMRGLKDSTTKLSNLSQKICLLDVSHNKITNLSDNEFYVIDMLIKRRHIEKIAVRNNPWLCDKSQNFVKLVCRNEVFISDRDQTNCSSENGNISIISKEFRTFCSDSSIEGSTSTTLLLLAILIPISILIILIILYYEYQQEVKIWLYAHNLFLWFLNDDDIDEEKKYDAFISYSHQDEDFAIDTIVAELENGTPNFKICVHVRDWIAGALISKSINKSIAESRRTIIILSKNYLDSVWGQYEFQCAHYKGIVEKRIRVIIIILSDIGNIDNLDVTLKAYLKTHTYITWGEPMFWMKLRYALQHWERP